MFAITQLYKLQQTWCKSILALTLAPSCNTSFDFSIHRCMAPKLALNLLNASVPDLSLGFHSEACWEQSCKRAVDSVILSWTSSTDIPCLK